MSVSDVVTTMMVGLAGLLGLAQPGEDDLGHLGGGGGELGEAARHPPAEAGEAGQGGGEVRGPGLLLQPLLANMTPWSVAGCWCTGCTPSLGTLRACGSTAAP